MKTVFEPTEAAQGVCPERIQRLDGMLQGCVDDGDMAGASILIGRGGKTAHFKAFGTADIAKNIPVQADTLFRIASMTKPITSFAVLQLVEEGRVLLNYPIENYLPEFKDGKVLENLPDSDAFRLVDPKRPMTVRDLLTHTSGLSYGGNEALNAFYRVANVTGGFEGFETLERAVLRLGKMPLAFHPGERWAYGYSTDVLGRLVEVVSGMELDAYFRERILDPLQMNDTYFRLPPEKAARLAQVYTKKEDGSLQTYPAQYPYEPPQLYLSGGAGLSSSIMDYARFCQMTLNGGELDGERILSPRSIELALRNHIGGLDPMGGPGYKFGLGFQIHADPGRSGSPESVGAYGWGGYWHTVFWIDPAKDMFVVKMSQVYPRDHLTDHLKLRPLVYQALLG